MDRLLTRLRHASNLPCTSAARWTGLLEALVRACCNFVNKPIDVARDGVMLCSIPRRLYHLSSDVVWDVLWMYCSNAYTLALWLGGRWGKWTMVSRFHSRTVF